MQKNKTVTKPHLPLNKADVKCDDNLSSYVGQLHRKMKPIATHP